MRPNANGCTLPSCGPSFPRGTREQPTVKAEAPRSSQSRNAGTHKGGGGHGRPCKHTVTGGRRQAHPSQNAQRATLLSRACQLGILLGLMSVNTLSTQWQEWGCQGVSRRDNRNHGGHASGHEHLTVPAESTSVNLGTPQCADSPEAGTLVEALEKTNRSGYRNIPWHTALP